MLRCAAAAALATIRPVPSALGQQISAGGHHSFAVVVGGGGAGWGSNLEEEPISMSPQPFTNQVQAQPAGKFWALLSAGFVHTCGVTRSGEGICWGSNGCVSINGCDARLAVPGGKRWSELSASWRSTCGVTTTGEGLCWGRDTYGQVSQIPAGKTWKRLSAGTLHTCGVTTTGEGLCWGNNGHNRISGMPANKLWTLLSTGERHTCGVSTSGEGICWGDNHNNKLGVPAGKKWAQISAGNKHTCGTTTSGEGYCWGEKGARQDEDDGRLDLPPNKTWAQISAGEGHSCGATTSAEVYCWGYDHRMQVSNKTNKTLDLAAAGFYRRGKDEIPCPSEWTSRPGAVTVLGCSVAWVCPRGQERNESSKLCVPCSPGTASGNGKECAACPSGRYQDVSGGANCTKFCPIGTFGGAPGLTSLSQCQLCSEGTFARFEGSESCAQCPAGSYENATGRYVVCDFVRRGGMRCDVTCAVLSFLRCLTLFAARPLPYRCQS